MQIKFKKFFYRHKLLTIISILLVIICLFYVTLNLTIYFNVTLPNNASSSFSSQATLVYVQKNQIQQMDNTIIYYQNILENNNKYTVDGFEIKVFLTRDNKIVVSSLDKLDDFSDCNKPPFNEKNVYIGNKSIGELKQYNIAYNIEKGGAYPYRSDNADLTYARIITLDELLNYLKVQNNIWKKNYKLIINIGSEKNAEATILALNNLLQLYYYNDYSVVVSNSDNIAKTLDKHPDLHRTATKSELIKFFYNTAFNIKNINIKYDLILLENFQCAINFGKKRYVSYAHYNGAPIIYRNAHTANKIALYANLSPDGIAGALPEEIYLAKL